MKSFTNAIRHILIICLAILLLLIVSQSLQIISAGTQKNVVYAHSYSKDYRFWNQGQSDYSDMRGYGCLVVAQAKMLKSAGINISNPDAWYKWLLNNGYLYNMYMQDMRAPEYYAKQNGVTLEMVSRTGFSDSKARENARVGSYSILSVCGSGVTGTHWVIVDNATTLNKNALYIWDSGNGYNFTSPRAFSSVYGGREMLTFSVKGVKPIKPSAPTNVKISKTDIGIGDAISTTWSKSSGATKYNVSLECTSNSSYNASKSVNSNNASFTVKHPGTYRVKVSASNSAGTSGTTTSSNTATVHNNCNVKFFDWDGTQIGATQSVKYGGNAKIPSVNPTREGYTFQKWSSDGKNIKTNTNISAIYKINTYSVSFVDYNDAVIGSVQKVNYLSAATPPSEIPTKEGYIFTGWSTEEYKQVKKSLTVKAVYVWENINLPIVTKITSAKRNAESTGYDITVKLSNFPNDFTKGKLVAALKTKNGKMVASETKSISMPSTGETTETMTILYSGLASTVDVSMIGVVDDETTGTPKAKVVSSAIDLGNTWSDWSTTVPEGDDIIKESRTEYRYKDRKVIKATTTPSTPTGYKLTDTANTGTYTGWGPWGSYSTARITKTTLRDVSTTTGYRYYAFQCPKCGTRDPYSGACSKCGYSDIKVGWKIDWGTVLGKNYGPGYTKIDNNKGRIYWQNKYWYFEFPGTPNGEGGTGQPTTTLYRSCTRQEYKNYTYWSANWSDWSATPATASDNKQVETRTTYRFKNNGTEVPCYNYKRYKFENVNTGKTVYTYTSAYADSMEYPGEWEYNVTFTPLNKVSVDTGDDVDLYGGTGDASWYKADVNTEGNVTVFETSKSLEDSIGTERIQEGTLENAAGKVATLMVYKGKNDDPIASQIEYIGQTTVNDDGSYRFEYITKEEPTAKTGDFVITLGIEGSTNYIVLDTIEAPKPIYYVDFVDEDGNAIGEQKTVASGGTVEAPEPPEKEGYDFICWDTGLKNITENTVITAIYEKKTYTVVFVDWDEKELDIKEFEYGDILSYEDTPEAEGKRFDKWLNNDGEAVITVTDNMIVSASYVNASYMVKFTDWDGNIISEQEVPYGEKAELPADLDAPSNNQVFSTWDRLSDLSFINSSMTVSPIAKYKEDSETPSFSIEDGFYADSQEVSIFSKNDADTYYYIQPFETGMPIDAIADDEYKKYNEDFTVNESSIVYAYSVSEGKNRSSYATSIIRIGEEEEAVIQAVIEAINSIPSVNEITLDNEESINNAQSLYNALSDAEKEQIDSALVDKLNESVAKIAELKEQSETKLIIEDNEKVTKDDNGYLRGIKGGTDKVSDIIQYFDNANVRCVNINNEPVESTALVGTGYKFQLIKNETVVDELPVVVKGDITCEGGISNRDISMLLRCMLNRITPTDAQLLAADINDDGSVNAKDAVYLSRVLVGKAEL